MKVIIDCDPGVDDALALLMCFSEASRRKKYNKRKKSQDEKDEDEEEIEILALCTTYGNVNCEQTTKNAAKILASADHFACFEDDTELAENDTGELKVREKATTNPLRIYKGCSSPLVKNDTKYYPFHGEDGLGDAENSLNWIHCFSSNSSDKSPIPSSISSSSLSPSSSSSSTKNTLQSSSVDYRGVAKTIGRNIEIANEHASIVINRLCSKYVDEITLIILGPMTNLALATKLDPNLPHKVKDVIWMGGTTFAKGNVTLTSEFNIHNDPEAAHIVLSEFPQTVMVTWECTIDHALEWKLFDDFLAKAKAKAAEENGKRYPQAFLLSHIMTPFHRDRDKFLEGAFLCDAVAMAVALERKDNISRNIDVEVESRKQMIEVSRANAVPRSSNNIVLEEVSHFVDIELGGKYCRGQTVLDWDGIHPPNVKRVEKINMQRFHEMLLHILEN